MSTTAKLIHTFDWNLKVWYVFGVLKLSFIPHIDLCLKKGVYIKLGQGTTDNICYINLLILRYEFYKVFKDFGSARVEKWCIYEN